MSGFISIFTFLISDFTVFIKSLVLFHASLHYKENMFFMESLFFWENICLYFFFTSFLLRIQFISSAHFGRTFYFKCLASAHVYSCGRTYFFYLIFLFYENPAFPCLKNILIKILIPDTIHIFRLSYQINHIVYICTFLYIYMTNKSVMNFIYVNIHLSLFLSSLHF